MTTELDLQLKIQQVIQNLSLFADADVVINDWTIFDRPIVEAPYVLIMTSNDFESLHQVMVPQTRWAIPIILVEAFTDWKETFNNFQARRQQILDTFNSGDDERAASGVNISRIFADTPIEEFYDRLIPTDQQPDSLPSFIMQRIIAETDLY